MREYFERALSNIIKHGDTDIFPYPIENRIFFDKKEAVQLLLDINKDFEENPTRFPPANNSALKICLEVSGHPASHTLSEIVRVISSGDISR